MPDMPIPYEKDWYAWTQDQAARLRELPAAIRPNGLDVEHLAEEVEDMGKSERRAVEAWMRLTMLHLLKLRFHPDDGARRGWRAEVSEFRAQLDSAFAESPSLHVRRAQFAKQVWPKALKEFRRQLQEHAPALPGVVADLDDAAPPFDLDAEILAQGWFPLRWAD